MIGCDTIEPFEGGPVGGKADGADDACVQEHNLWLTLDYAPLDCEEGPACVGQVELESMPECDGQPDYATWRAAWDRHIYRPIMRRRTWARDEYTMPESPYFLDHERFVQMTAATDAEVSAHAAMLSVSHTPDSWDYIDWLQRYEAILYRVASPLTSQANLAAVEGNGRNVCGDPFAFEATSRLCDHEPALFLSSSEHQLLSLLEDAAPAIEGDGPSAQWTRLYHEMLAGGETARERLAFEFPIESEQGLAQYELEFFERLRSMRPTPVGTQDSDVWMSYYAMMLLSADLDLGDQVLQLDLFESVRPPVLVGVPAYAAWLHPDLLDLIRASGNQDENKLQRFLAVKPCARDDAELEGFQSVFASEELPTATPEEVALLAPATCES